MYTFFTILILLSVVFVIKDSVCQFEDVNGHAGINYSFLRNSV